MNISFGKIHAENFMSFKSVDFDFNSFGSKVVLVTGRNDDINGENCRNGAGKTTIFNALLYSIYGEMLQTPKAQHISNWNCSPKDDVRLTLQVKSNGTDYEIDRFLVGKKKSAELHVYENGCDGFKEITRSTIAETQKLIETDIVPCGKDGFLRCILLTADKDYNFFELGKSAKNEFFESLFELTVYTNMFNKLHRDTLDENNTIIASSRTIDQLNANISKLKSERDIEEKNHSEITEAEEYVKKCENKLSEFDSINSVVLLANGNIDFGKDEEYENVVSKGKILNERIKNGNSMIDELRRKINLMKSEYDSFEYKIKNEESSIKSMERTISAHSHITDILCNDCLPKYKNEVNISNYETEIENRKNNIKNIVYEKNNLLPTITEQETVLKRYMHGVEMLNDELSKYRDKVIEIKEKRIKIQNSRNLLVSDIKNARYKVSVLKEGATKSFDTPIKSLEVSLKNEKLNYDRYNKDISHMKSLESILKPENIRKSVVSDMLKELNFRICGYLSKMGSNYSCKFDDDFDAIFTSSKGIDTEYKNFSAGEKMRLSIACCFAFKDFMQVRLNIHSNILAIDEYIDSNLDPLSVNGIMELIRYMVGTEKITAYIISHRSEVLNSMADAEILVSKKDDQSKIEIFNKE